MINSAIDGFSATVFAYGQTGSGKTYTITGDESSDNSHGIIPRAVYYIFEQIEAMSNQSTTFTVRASYLELYNEQVRDLLNPNTVPLALRWTKQSGYYVENQWVVTCANPDDLMAVVMEGTENRITASHAMNMDSSRSHALLAVHIECQTVDPFDQRQVSRYGKITFVDLAGSERLNETKSEGLTKKETGQINKSLFTLGTVISSLSDSTKRSHVPYRDSKLTKLLMDSLGGRALTLMIACCSPSHTSEEFTMGTLKYAKRAKRIRNKPVVQMDEREQLIQELKRENRILKLENQYLREQSGIVIPPDLSSAPHYSVLPKTADGNSEVRGVHRRATSARSGPPKPVRGHPLFQAPHANGTGHNNSPGGGPGPSRSARQVGSGVNGKPPPMRRASASALPPMAAAMGPGGNGRGLEQSDGTPQGMFKELTEARELIQEVTAENARLLHQYHSLQQTENHHSRDYERVLSENEMLARRLDSLEEMIRNGGSPSLSNGMGGGMSPHSPGADPRIPQRLYRAGPGGYSQPSNLATSSTSSYTGQYVPPDRTLTPTTPGQYSTPGTPTTDPWRGMPTSATSQVTQGDIEMVKNENSQLRSTHEEMRRENQALQSQLGDMRRELTSIASSPNQVVRGPAYEQLMKS
eukprot:TRINITY_DN2542_c0_g2_i2.p1 TRINITY_DN2542_c0_g2~~TRINITY_DN2542_c0_g2_i2.p1  ORF type:complete len:640 (-),score=107.13 TRINITY_DN2542_c0_g2_i2:122-2041(-)